MTTLKKFNNDTGEWEYVLSGPKGDTGATGAKGDKGDRGGWDYATGLADGVNLNTLIAPGMYRRANSVGSTTALNYPVDGFAGFIEVIAGSTASSIQRATAWNSTAGATGSSRNTWWRAQVGGVWQAWTIISRDSEGIGSPEGVIHAAVGARYIDTAATNGAVEWIKASGTGPTGWKVTYGETWRNLSSEILTTDGFIQDGAAFRLHRTGGTCALYYYGLTNNSPTSGNKVAYVLPNGFRVANTAYFRTHDDQTGYITSGGVTFQKTSTAPMTYRGTVIWTTTDPWPTTLPGTAA